jgi:diguanylate cyclase (GGDEF)-like protein
VACGVPKRITAEKILGSLPSPEAWARRRPHIVRTREKDSRKIVLPCQETSLGGVFVWGVMQSVSSQDLADAQLLLEHSENSLNNLEKFEQIKQQTFLDDLTGLYNARYLKFAIDNALLRCKRPDQSFSVLFLDVDRFKAVNDRYGHVVGSEFLVAIGKTIKNSVRNIDPVFRYGGDEFVVILQDTALEGAVEIAERLRRQVERREFVIQSHRLRTTVSVGIAVCPEHASEREALLKLADEAMYNAKRGTRNAVSLAIDPTNKRQVG